MLYDPKWKRETVADLIAWLETQPAGECYQFHTCGDCLIARWMVGVGRAAWPEEILQIYNGRDPGRIAVGWGPFDWTYGKALARAPAKPARRAPRRSK